MIVEDFFIQLHHFHTSDTKTFFFKTTYNFSDKGSLHRTWFEQNKGSFHINSFAHNAVSELHICTNRRQRYKKKLETPTFLTFFPIEKGIKGKLD